MAAVAAVGALKAGGGSAAVAKGGFSAKAGSMTRSTGGKMMHSSNESVRKAGSKMMRVKDEQVAKALDTAQNTLSKINGTAAKILGTLAKHSPALQQQMIVLGKAFGLFLRPIGDLLARWLRPMAQWLIKVAMRWYKLFGGSGTAKDDKGDVTKALEEQAQMWEAFGDFDKAAELRAEIDNLIGSVKKTYTFLDAPIFKKDWWTEQFSNFSSWMANLPANLDNWWSSTKDWFLDFPNKWNNWTSGAKEWWETSKSKFDDWTTPAKEWWQSSKSRFDEWTSNARSWFINLPFNLNNWWNNAKNWFLDLPNKLNNWWTNARNWITTLPIRLSDWWNNFRTWVLGLGNRVGQWFEDGSAGIRNWGNRVWSMMSSAAGSLINRASFGLLGSKATGGEIQKTGVYQLHAGERVLTAGQTSRQNSSGSINITNYFTINSTINNDFDVSNIARKLADYQDTEIRRRVSYGGY